MIGYKKGYRKLYGKYYIRYNPEYFTGSLKGPSIIDNKDFLKNENGERSREQSSEQDSDRSGEQNREQRENGTSYTRQDKNRLEKMKKKKKNGKEMENDNKGTIFILIILFI